MRLGTETLLTYNVQISFTNKPTNLTFYSNSQKTNAIIIENGNQLVLDGFMSLNDNKKRDIPIYWDWPLETGSSQTEIDENDVIDSGFMGKTMSMQIATTGKQVTENPLTTKYAVTFDANGGNLQGYGNSGQAIKMVTYGETYGDLPTPTREGYRFLGWNGKNMFNYDTNRYYQAATIKETINNELAYTRNSKYSNSAMPNIWPIFYTRDIKFEKGKTYTISFDIWSDYEVDFDKRWFYINSQITVNHNLTTITPSKQKIMGTFTYNDGGDNSLHIYPVIYSDNNYYISNIQAEEGNIATAYEPYYMTSSTTVTQNKNHTLTAIWEKE